MNIPFIKAEGTGNDFIIIDENDLPEGVSVSELAAELCSRKRSVGADGLLICGDSQEADLSMRIINPDGGEVQMCGNGARCVALYAYKLKGIPANMKLQTKAGLIEIEIKNDVPKLKLTEPSDIKLDFDLEVDGETIRANFINTGVEHVVVVVDNLEEYQVAEKGRQLRYHEAFKPQGANANFVEFIDEANIKVRTYERGVEAETLACGTGAAASALISALIGKTKPPVNVHTLSGDILKISFNIEKNAVNNVYLEGKCNLIYQGKYIKKEK